MSRPSALLLLLAAGCAPQNVQIESGDYTAFLGVSQSLTVQKDVLAYDDFDRRHQIDCREFATAETEAETESLRLPNRQPVCRGDEGPNGTIGRNEWPPDQEFWMDNDGFEVVGDTLEPWRGLAMITSEGDVQIGFHQRLPGGEDFRFYIVVDPNFRPRFCQEQADGSVAYTDIDGQPWLEAWNDSLTSDEDGQLFFLNSGAYQFALAGAEVQAGGYPWFLPTEWQAGTAVGKFSQDLLRGRSSRYGEPSAYLNYDEEAGLTGGAASSSLEIDDVWYAWFAGLGAGEDIVREQQRGIVDRANTVADELSSDLLRFAYLNDEAAFASTTPWAPRVHDNLWRGFDNDPAGLQNWVEMHQNWVRFDPGSELEVGGAASGEFNVVLDARDSQTRVFVRGKFTVDGFRRDRWAPPYVPDMKFEEYGTTVCGVPGAEIQ